MTISQGQEPLQVDWWANGDTPVHTDARIAYYVDGRMFLQSFCRHLLLAQKYIYLANWGVTATMTLVRGTDWRAGPDGSPEQEALIAKLRAEGLAEPEIAFWTTQPLTLQNVLGYMVRKGVGWLLKDAYPAKPKEVLAFLLPRAARAPRLALRIACEKMTASDRAAVRAAG